MTALDRRAVDHVPSLCVRAHLSPRGRLEVTEILGLRRHAVGVRAQVALPIVLRIRGRQRQLLLLPLRIRQARLTERQAHFPVLVLLQQQVRFGDPRLNAVASLKHVPERDVGEVIADRDPRLNAVASLKPKVTASALRGRHG